MITPDMINAGFEAGAGFAVLHHCWRLRQDKQVRGVSAPAVMFFTLWGLWNIFFYPHLGQYWSFIGGIFVTLTNALYVAMLIHYLKVGADDTAEAPAEIDDAQRYHWLRDEKTESSIIVDGWTVFGPALDQAIDEQISRTGVRS